MVTRSPFSSRTLLPRAPEITSASFAPATRYRCAANSATRTSTATVARTSSVMVSVISNPFFLCQTAGAVLWRRKRADGHRHAMHAQYFDLAAACDRRLRGRRQCLHRAVVGECDRAVATLADAREEEKRRAEHGRAGEDQLQCVGAHRDRQLSGRASSVSDPTPRQVSDTTNWKRVSALWS